MMLHVDLDLDMLLGFAEFSCDQLDFALKDVQDDLDLLAGKGAEARGAAMPVEPLTVKTVRDAAKPAAKGSRWSRSLSPQAKALMVGDVLKKNPNMTDAHVAQEMSISVRTVQKWKADVIIGKAWHNIGGKVLTGFVDAGEDGGRVLDAVDPASPGMNRLKSEQARKLKPEKRE